MKNFTFSWRLPEIVFVIVVISAIWLIIVLLGFSPQDQSWSQNLRHSVIRNPGGAAGAWTADVLFSAFGVLAYFIPFGIIVFCHAMLRQRDSAHSDYFSLSLRLIGLLILLLSSCVLAAVNVDDFHYFASGGFIGSLMSRAILSWLEGTVMTLTLLGIWAAGFTLLTGWSWLFVAEKTGALISGIISFFSRDLPEVKDVNPGHYSNNNIPATVPTDAWLKNSVDQREDDLFVNNIHFEDALFSAPAITEVDVDVDVIDNISEQVKTEAQEEPQTDDYDTPPLSMQYDDNTPVSIVPSALPGSLSTMNVKAVEKTIDYQPTKTAPPDFTTDSLIHPFLTRNNQSLQKVTTALPGLDLLADPPAEVKPPDRAVLEETARLIEMRLADYRIKAQIVGIHPGPVITRFELDLAPGIKAARISGLSRDLARSLSAAAVLVVEVIPGKPWVGLELPNRHRQTVYLREVLDCARFRNAVSPLTVVLGKDIAGQPVVADLAGMPHLLVAGTTGSGKSVGVNAMILSMLYKAVPDEVRFIMIDPKMLELSVYEGIPHLLTEVVTDMKDAANALRWCVAEMERRYKLMSELGVRSLAGYNERITQAQMMNHPIPDPLWKPGNSMDVTAPALEKLPWIVVIVDEFADLMMTSGKKVEELIARLAQKARAAGIHLILATQRPSVDVITGLIKANIPSRIAFTVSSKIDSRTILDQGGAESLLGRGDMLYMPPGASTPVRIHGAFVHDQEVHAVVNDWKARGQPQYISSILEGGNDGENGHTGGDNDEALDPLFDQAVAFVLEKRRASISSVQRQFRIGYNRAARIIEQMEMQQIISAQGHNGNREILARRDN